MRPFLNVQSVKHPDQHYLCITCCSELQLNQQATPDLTRWTFNSAHTDILVTITVLHIKYRLYQDNALQVSLINNFLHLILDSSHN